VTEITEGNFYTCGIRQSNKWTFKRSLSNKIPTSNETLLFSLQIWIMKGYKLTRHLAACSTLPPTFRVPGYEKVPTYSHVLD
jgi:hypothetical protein